MPFQAHSAPGGASFTVKAQPGAGRTGLAGTWQDAIKIKLSKKPEDGAANHECLAFLSELLEVPQRGLSIVKGEFSRLKVIRVEGLTKAQVEQRIGAHL